MRAVMLYSKILNNFKMRRTVSMLQQIKCVCGFATKGDSELVVKAMQMHCKERHGKQVQAATLLRSTVSITQEMAPPSGTHDGNAHPEPEPPTLGDTALRLISWATAAIADRARSPLVAKVARLTSDRLGGVAGDGQSESDPRSSLKRDTDRHDMRVSGGSARSTAANEVDVETVKSAATEPGALQRQLAKEQLEQQEYLMKRRTEMMAAQRTQQEQMMAGQGLEAAIKQRSSVNMNHW